MKLYLWIPICAILIVVVANARTIGDIPAKRSLNAEEESEVDEYDHAEKLRKLGKIDKSVASPRAIEKFIHSPTIGCIMVFRILIF